MADSLSKIKLQIMKLYEENPMVHMDLSFKSERKHLENVCAEITAVYPKIFTVKINENGVVKNCSFQYTDILIHTVTIKELTR